jgi:mitochondrial distribution and morphology protein 34
MLLRLSHFKLSSYVVLVVSKQKGITLVFKTDPLQNVDINSTFDSIAVIQKFIQREIEGQLRQMFREDLPGIIHRLSQQWVKAKVEAPYLHQRDTPSTIPGHLSSPDLRPHSFPARTASSSNTHTSRSRLGPASSTGSNTSNVHATKMPSLTPVSPSHSSPRELPGASFPEAEDWDPTYGLRPEGLPSRAAFSSLKRLFGAKKGGLADLAEEMHQETPQDADEFVERWEHFSEFGSPTTLSDEMTEYESLPAVGGGMITRPRVVHGQSPALSTSATRPPSTSSLLLPLMRTSSAPDHSTPSSRTVSSSPRAPGLASRSMSTVSNPYFPRMLASQVGSVYDDDTTELAGPSIWPHQSLEQSRRFALPPTPPLSHSSSRRPVSSTNAHATSRSSHTIVTPPLSDNADDVGLQMKTRGRRISTSSSDFEGFKSGSPPDHHYLSDASTRRIIARPALSNPVSQLHTLSHSNHTLSPFTRTFQHFAVRSGPRKARTPNVAVAERQPVKAKRKRIHRLGAKKLQAPEEPTEEANIPLLGGEFDTSEMDRYFRVHDDHVISHDELSQSRLRPRRSHQHLP